MEWFDFAIFLLFAKVCYEVSCLNMVYVVCVLRV
jgi:hypothetical protein